MTQVVLIDVIPPPYQPPPAYGNLDDPFDTCGVPPQRPSSSPGQSVGLEREIMQKIRQYGAPRNYVASDICNRGVNLPQSSAPEVGVIANNLSLMKFEESAPPAAGLDREFLDNLESVATAPAANRVDESTCAPSTGQSSYSNLASLYAKSSDLYAKVSDNSSHPQAVDTKTVMDKMWFDAQSVGAPKRSDIYVVSSEFGEFRSNRRYDPVYQSASELGGLKGE